MLMAFAGSTVAGLVGSLLGLGGGLIVVPMLTLLLGVHDIKYAIGASIVSVIATSSGAGASYVKSHIANIRVGMFLEPSTTLAAILGAFVTGFLDDRVLYVLFGCLMAATAVAMSRQKEGHQRPLRPDPIADRLALHGGYHDPATGKDVTYRVCRSRFGFIVSGFAGLVSGLLGVGGGIMKVPIMSLAMDMPMKSATATSNFMMGTTAAASAAVYFARGDIDPLIAGPVATGVLLGATVGSRMLRKIEARSLKLAFMAVLLVVAVQMLLKGVRG